MATTTTQTRAQWSYHVSEVRPSDMVEYESKMADLGRQGWELVSATSLSLHGTFSTASGGTNRILFVWKRPI